MLRFEAKLAGRSELGGEKLVRIGHSRSLSCTLSHIRVSLSSRSAVRTAVQEQPS